MTNAHHRQSTPEFSARKASQESLFQLISVFLAATISITSLFVLSASFHFDYNSIRTYLAQLYGQERTERYFTPSVFSSFLFRLRLGAAIMQVLAITLFGLRSRFAHYFERFCRAVLESHRHSRRWRSGASNVYTLALGLITLFGLLLRLHYICQPMRYDESATVLGYASKPFYVGLSIYNEPNNHLFHTLLVHISMLLAGSSEWAVRLPALIAGTMLCPLAYGMGYRLSTEVGGLLSAALVSTSSILIEYSTNARGYTLVCCAAVALLIAGIEVLECASPWWFFLLGLTGVLGFWTIPIFLFPFGGTLLWLAMEAVQRRGTFRRVFWLRLMITCLLTAAFTIFVYLLPIAANGAKALFQNQWVAPQNFEAWLRGNEAQLHMINTLWSRDLPIGWTLILTISFCWSVVTYPRLRRLLISIIVWTLFLLVIRRFVPFARTWLMYLPLVYTSSAMGLAWFLERLVPTKQNGMLGIACSVVVVAVLSVFIVRSDSVLVSPETGVLRSAPQIVEFMAAKGIAPETVFRSPTSDLPLQYYWWRRTGYRSKNPSKQVLDRDGTHQAWCVVNSTYGETLESFSDQNGFQTITILREQSFRAARVYHFEWKQTP